MGFQSFMLGVLSIWRITHLLNAEDGPWNSMVRLRRQAGAGFAGQLLDCFYCLSVWTAAPYALCLEKQWHKRILLWPALSAGAILLERITDHGYVGERALLFEESEDEHVLLWQKESPITPSQSGS